MRKKLTTYKQPSIVSGMSIDDIMNVDIETFLTLKKSDMQKYVGRLVSAANKRISRMEAAGIYSPALSGLNRKGKQKFSAKNKNLNQLRKEFIKAKQFMENETSSLQGYKRVRNKVIDTLSTPKKDEDGNVIREAIHITKKQYDDFWRTFEKTKEVDERMKLRNVKYDLLKEIEARMDGTKTMDDIIAELSEKQEETIKNEKGEEITIEKSVLDKIYEKYTQEDTDALSIKS